MSKNHEERGRVGYVLLVNRHEPGISRWCATPQSVCLVIVFRKTLLRPPENGEKRVVVRLFNLYWPALEPTLREQFVVQSTDAPACPNVQAQCLLFLSCIYLMSELETLDWTCGKHLGTLRSLFRQALGTLRSNEWQLEGVSSPNTRFHCIWASNLLLRCSGHLSCIGKGS